MSEPAPLLAPLKPVVQAPQLWNGRAFVADAWQTIADDTPFPFEGHAIISLTRWRAEHTAIAAPGVAVGIFAGPAETLDPATDDVARLSVIALAFPKFTDGRAYSTARRLREAGFTGEIRATGDVLLDQLPLMLRAGFNTFEIAHAATVRALEAAPVPAVSRVYQSDSATQRDTWQSRRTTRIAQGCKM